MKDKKLTKYLSEKGHKANALVADWHAPYPQSNIDVNLNSFAQACRYMKEKKMEAQFWFSHLILSQQWKEAKIWYNHVLDEEYEEEGAIPEHVKVTTSLRQRWTSQEQFIKWCENNIPGFKRSTFWRRHVHIDKFIELGMSLPTATKIVAGLSVWSASEQIQRIFQYTDEHVVVGVDSEKANRLPGLEDNPIEEDEDPDEALERAKEAAIEYAIEKSIAVEEGEHARNIATEVKRKIHRRPQIAIFRSELPEFHYIVELTTYDDDNDNGYGDGEVEHFAILLTKMDGTVLGKIPDRLEVLENRLRVRKPPGIKS